MTEQKKRRGRPKKQKEEVPGKEVIAEIKEVPEPSIESAKQPEEDVNPWATLTKKPEKPEIVLSRKIEALQQELITAQKEYAAIMQSRIRREPTQAELIAASKRREKAIREQKEADKANKEQEKIKEAIKALKANEETDSAK